MKYIGKKVTTKDIAELYSRINSLEKALLVERARAILTFDSAIRNDMFDNWRDVDEDEDDEVKYDCLDSARRELEGEGIIPLEVKHGDVQVFRNGKWVVQDQIFRNGRWVFE